MSTNNRYLVAYCALSPLAIKLTGWRQEFRDEQCGFTLSHRMNGSLVLYTINRPDDPEITVPPDGTVVEGQMGAFFRRFCICASAGDAASMIEQFNRS